MKSMLAALITGFSLVICPTTSLLADEVVNWSPESIPGAEKVDAERLIELVYAKPDLVMIDSRVNPDRTQGYIEDSISLPDTLTNCSSLAEIIPSKQTASLFYCNGPKCGRSAKAVKKALGCKYQNVFWFRGGLHEWKEKGYPLLKAH